jgi:glutaredoxin
MVKQYLTQKAFDYEEVNLDTNPDQREQVAKYTDALTVPVTVIEQTGTAPKVFVGWNPSHMIPALMQLELLHA